MIIHVTYDDLGFTMTQAPRTNHTLDERDHLEADPRRSRSLAEQTELRGRTASHPRRHS